MKQKSSSGVSSEARTRAGLPLPGNCPLCSPESSDLPSAFPLSGRWPRLLFQHLRNTVLWGGHGSCRFRLRGIWYFLSRELPTVEFFRSLSIPQSLPHQGSGVVLMERSDDDEDSISKDLSVRDSSDEDPQYVERDPTGRYGRYDEVLGKGAYKTVYRAFDDLEGIEVAWNQVNIRNKLHNSGEMERLYSELHLLKMLKHENIMKFCNAWVDPRCQNVNFITEIFTSGTLRQYRQKHKHVNLRAIKHWSRQILQGLVYLHSHNPPVIHRDLKCDNIFINGNSGEVKIGDLGLAVILSQAPAAHSVIGTPEFMAPEFYEEHYNELVDIYSFGMCLLELVTLEYPYSECTNAAQIYKKVTTGRKPEALNKVKDLEMRKFVEKCIASASERLHAKELLMDQFLQMDEYQRVLDSCLSMTLDPHDDLRDLYPIFQASESQPATQSEDTGKEVEVCREKGTEEGSITQSSPMSSSPTPSENHGLDFHIRALRRKRSRDFRIKVKQQDDKKVLVRFRITSLKGGVRYIQFDFELETDTAMDVANEMVAELDLIDQDPTVIAGMIDAELTALLPDWKPGPCREEAEVIDFVSMPQEHILKSSDVEGPEENELDIPPALEAGEAPCSLNGTLVHGRFEEVGFNTSESHHARQEPDSMGCFSDFSSEQLEGGGSDLSLDASFDRLNAETCSRDILASQNMEEVITDAQVEMIFPTKESDLSSFEGDVMIHKLEGDDYSDELRLLMLQQKQEIQCLKSKHDLELLDLETQLSQENLTSISSPLSQGELLHEAVISVEQSNERNGGEICQLDDNEVTELLYKTFKDRIESTVCETVLIDHLDVSNVLVGTELPEEGCFDAYLQPQTSFEHDLNAQILAGHYVKPVCEASHYDEDTVDGATLVGGTTLDIEKETKIGKPDSFTSAEMGIVSSGEVSESKGCTSPHVPESSTEPFWLPTSTHDQDFALKRESYFEYYKAGSAQREKMPPMKHGASDKTILESLDSNYEEMDNLRKLQLKKSIADLEAKTLECFSQSSSYIAKRIGRTPGASIQSGQPASLGRQ
ncbi:hypothetical protein GOP47_0019989 [Adiantum capillus-veneris]|uniref:non-specific serine/threonine protein kinase n=1 Tax=Adiantum capillus-veneris TaxID=13818 RepID=A0A9D4UDI2_ADICA|nr:hypothetical protein GOP47_0019989 [Adiantum capillus-veneris]